MFEGRVVGGPVVVVVMVIVEMVVMVVKVVVVVVRSHITLIIGQWVPVIRTV